MNESNDKLGFFLLRIQKISLFLLKNDTIEKREGYL